MSGGYLRHIRALNPPLTEPFLPWEIDGRRVGWLRPAFARELSRWPGLFSISAQGVSLAPGLQGFERRSEALAEVVAGLAAEGVVAPPIGEPYPVTPGGREAALCVIDRAAVAWFGLRAFGQHLNGYVREGDRLFMWLGRRARDRKVFPGALDNLVAGGLPYGIGLQENLRKECLEEAGMPAALVARAHPVGALGYNAVTPKGLRPDVLYCYDLELPAAFRPRNTDGEVESFQLLPIETVMEIVSESDEFKPNCNLVVIDFLIRQGLLPPEHPEYLEIQAGLRPPPGLPGPTEGVESAGSN